VSPLHQRRDFIHQALEIKSFLAGLGFLCSATPVGMDSGREAEKA
jgi:hypothetical protein